MLDRKRHINEAHQRFQKLVRWEVVPLVLLSLSVVVYFKFQTELLNYIIPTNLLKFQAFSDKEERFIARKLSSLMSQSYSMGKITLRKELVESQIVECLYEVLLKHCHEVGLLTLSVKKSEIVIYYSEVSSNQNYHQLFILSNGSLFLSEVRDAILKSYIHY